jgi:hypothetical protein
VNSKILPIANLDYRRITAMIALRPIEFKPFALPIRRCGLPSTDNQLPNSRHWQLVVSGQKGQEKIAHRSPSTKSDTPHKGLFASNATADRTRLIRGPWRDVSPIKKLTQH